MSISLSRSIVAALLGSALATNAFAQTTPRLTVRPQVRIVDKVDTKTSSVIANSMPAIVASSTDNGRLASATAMPHMKLVLKSSDEQEAALHGLLDDQQDKSSPNYHKWMTPDTFGTTFGAASADIAKVSAWLQDAGFSIDAISPGGRVIQFSGTSGQVETAFKTEMHKITVNGESHISNTKNISVPAALSPVIAGVASLNDFRPRSRAVNPRTLVMGTDGQLHPVIPGTTTPDYTSVSSGNHYVGPGDLATIYNGTPLTSSGINGTGVTIGIIGQTSVSLSDIQTYRQMFNLPVNDPQIINVGPAPGVIADDIESDLDLELAGSLATKAAIKFYTAPVSLVDSGIDTSAVAVVDTNGADIISLSYGGCEVSNAASGTAFWNTLWEQAAAQGQTVFVSTGDSSATGCASSSATLATGTAGAYGVNALGSGAYNVAVGGSMFNEGATALTGGVTAFWGPGGISPYGTALSYIPENVWSEGVFDPISASTGISGGGGGVSIFTARPSWQVGPGIGADPAGPVFTASGAIPAGQLHRLVPDVSLIAAGGHDGTIFCSEGSCKLASDGSVAGIGVVGGTSVATPTMAGVQALINQKNGGRQGNANYYYYKLAAASATASLDCTSSSATSKLPAAGCNFNDVVQGNNYSPKTNKATYNVSTGAIGGTFGTDYIGFQATAGYDVATGLGTPNITNLANNWKTVTFNASKTTLTLTPTTTTHGTAITAAIGVTSTAGIPTGDVSLIAVGQSAGAGDGTFYTLDATGNVSAQITSLPGGTYSVIARYTGDSVYGGSDSAPVTVTIAKEASTMLLASYNITTAGATPAATSFAYGTSIYLDTEIQGVSNNNTYTGNGGVPVTGAPTGTVTYTATGAAGLPTYISTLDSYGTTYLEVGQTFTNFNVFANYPVISPGAYAFTATYSGDNSFGTVNKTANLTVVKATVAPVLRAGTAEIASGATASFNVTVAASGAGVLPTGTVTLTDNTTSTVLGSGTLANGAVVITSALITTNGAHSIVAAYGGDTNYNASTSTAATVTVGGTATSLTLVSSVPTAKVLTSVSFTATIPTGVTGTVYFYDGALVLGSATISNSTHLATLTLATLPAGTHNVTATYAGSATYQSATSNVAQVVIAQNTPTLQLTTQQANAAAVNIGMSANLTLSPVNAAAANPAPSVPVQFLDGTTVLGSVPLSYTLNYHTYNSSFTSTGLKPGPHTLTASFAGDNNYAAASSNVQTINIGLTTTTVTASSTNVGITPVTFTAKVVPQVANTTAVGGSVSFYDGATLLGTATVTNGTGSISSTLPGVATHSITAVYTGDTNFYTSTSTALIVNTDLTTTTVTASSTNVGITPVTFTAKVVPQIANATVLTGSVSFYDGATLLGTSAVSGGMASISSTLPGVATHSITAVYTGDSSYYSSTSAAFLVSTDLTTVAVTTSQATYGTNMPATLTATVTPVIASTTVITGTVKFYDGTTLLGTSTVANGVATLTTTFTTVTTHALSVVYSGDSYYYSSASSTALNIVTVVPSFTITVSPTTLTVPRGGSGTLTVTSTVTGNYNGFANFTCQGLPVNTYCVFTQPAALMAGANGNQAQGTITVFAASPIATNRTDATSSIRSAGLLWIPAMFLAGFLGLRRKQLSLRGRQLMGFAILLCGMMAISGCNDAITTPNGTPTGTTSFTVVASGNGVTSASPNITATATVSLAVQ